MSSVLARINRALSAVCGPRTYAEYDDGRQRSYMYWSAPSWEVRAYLYDERSLVISVQQVSHDGACVNNALSLACSAVCAEELAQAVGRVEQAISVSERRARRANGGGS